MLIDSTNLSEKYTALFLRSATFMQPENMLQFIFASANVLEIYEFDIQLKEKWSELFHFVWSILLLFMVACLLPSLSTSSCQHRQHGLSQEIRMLYAMHNELRYANDDICHLLVFIWLCVYVCLCLCGDHAKL